MPAFSIISKAKLRTCHRDLQVLFEEVVREYDCTIVCGHRHKEEQDAAYASGNSQLKWPNSKHNPLPSKAVDAVPYEKGGLDWGKTQSAFFAGYVKGVSTRLFEEGKITHRIRFGVDWDSDNDIDDTTFWDACHFEIIDKIII